MTADCVFAQKRRTGSDSELCVASRFAGRNWPIKEDKQRPLSLIGGEKAITWHQTASHSISIDLGAQSKYQTALLLNDQILIILAKAATRY